MIPILWHAEKEGRGRYNSTAMLNEMFDTYECVHHPCGGIRMVPKNIDGAVVVVHGCQERGSIDRLNADIENLKWVLLIFIGDEEASFPVEQVVHPNKKVWKAEPIPGRHNNADRFLLNGYPHDCKEHVVKCYKDLDWVFAGQVTHQRRIDCVDALRRIPWGGIIVETKGYTQGVSRAEYYHLLCRAKMAPCPSGPYSPDAARPWEALECGTIPILDTRSAYYPETEGFWDYIFGGADHPFPVISNWEDLPEFMELLKPRWEPKRDVCVRWWKQYKEDFQTWLGLDLKALGVTL